MEDDLINLARMREAQSEAVLSKMLLESPSYLRRQLRHYISRQVDRGRMKRPDEGIPRLETFQGGLDQLSCERAEFYSGTWLSFKIELRQQQGGWALERFQFHVHLVERRIHMVRIHLNNQTLHDPLAVPRCHLHIGGSKAHVPFPVMNPRLILDLICEHIERDFGA
jgi:hypothetical protein